MPDRRRLFDSSSLVTPPEPRSEAVSNNVEALTRRRTFRDIAGDWRFTVDAEAADREIERIERQIQLHRVGSA